MAFEKALDSLIRESHELLNRIDKGKKMLQEVTISGGVSGEAERYAKQITRLRNLQFRASVCIDVLNGDVALIAQVGDEILVAKRLDERIAHLVEEAQKLGAEIESMEKT